MSVASAKGVLVAQPEKQPLTMVIDPSHTALRSHTDDQLNELAIRLFSNSKESEKAYIEAYNLQHRDRQAFINICMLNITKELWEKKLDAQEKVLALICLTEWSILALASFTQTLHKHIEPITGIASRTLQFLDVSGCEKAKEDSFSFVKSKEEKHLSLSGEFPVLETFKADDAQFRTIQLKAPLLSHASVSWNVYLYDFSLQNCTKLRSLDLTGNNKITRVVLTPLSLQTLAIEGCSSMRHLEFFMNFPLFASLDLSNFSNESITALATMLNEVLSDGGLTLNSLPEELKAKWLENLDATIRHQKELSVLINSEGNLPTTSPDPVEFLPAHAFSYYFSKDSVAWNPVALLSPSELGAKMKGKTDDPESFVRLILSLVSDEDDSFPNSSSFMQLLSEKLDTDPEAYLPHYVCSLKNNYQITVKDAQTEFKKDLLRTVIHNKVKENSTLVPLLLQSCSQTPRHKEFTDFIVELLSSMGPEIVPALSKPLCSPEEKEPCGIVLRVLRNLKFSPRADLIPYLSIITNFYYEEPGSEERKYEAIETLGVIGAAHTATTINILKSLQSQVGTDTHPAKIKAINQALHRFDLVSVATTLAYQTVWTVQATPIAYDVDNLASSQKPVMAASSANSAGPRRRKASRWGDLSNPSITPTPKSDASLSTAENETEKQRKNEAWRLSEAALLKYEKDKASAPGRTKEAVRTKQVVDLRKELLKIRNNSEKKLASMISAIQALAPECKPNPPKTSALYDTLTALEIGLSTL